MDTSFSSSAHIITPSIMAKVGQKNYRRLAEYAIVFLLFALLHIVSNIVLAQNDATLKVTFSTPEVTERGNHSLLQWKLTSIAPMETAFSFEVWRSLDKGASFERVMEGIPVESKNDYLITDYDAISLTNDELIYKVRAVNTDGFFKYSDEVHLRPRRSGYPIHASITSGNPASENLRVHCDFSSMSSPYVYISILNMQGAVVYKDVIRGDVNGGDLNIDIKDWKLGVYFVNVYKDDYQMVEKIIVR
ncbi:MAG: T9SS type A sorting domain-containing protein [Bacteroidia bacterium]